jgi:hypothetical protein
MVGSAAAVGNARVAAWILPNSAGETSFPESLCALASLREISRLNINLRDLCDLREEKYSPHFGIAKK